MVALSFSSAFPARQLPEVLRQLRASLPPGVEAGLFESGRPIEDWDEAMRGFGDA